MLIQPHSGSFVSLMCIDTQPRTKSKILEIFESDLLQIIFCLNKLCSLTGDTSFALRRLVSTKNSSNFFSTFSLLNHAVVKSNLVFAEVWQQNHFGFGIFAHVCYFHGVLFISLKILSGVYNLYLHALFF